MTKTQKENVTEGEDKKAINETEMEAKDESIQNKIQDDVMVTKHELQPDHGSVATCVEGKAELASDSKSSSQEVISEREEVKLEIKDSKVEVEENNATPDVTNKTVEEIKEESNAAIEAKNELIKMDENKSPSTVTTENKLESEVESVKEEIKMTTKVQESQSPEKVETSKPPKTWGRAGSKTAEPPKEPELKEKVSLKKVKPQQKKEEDKKVETPALKPTPKTVKGIPEESKETVQLKAVKKEVQNTDDVTTQDDQHETKSNVAPKKKKKVRLNVEENVEKSNKDEVKVTAEEEITDMSKEESNIPDTQESPETITHSDDKEQNVDTTTQVEIEIDAQQVLYRAQENNVCIQKSRKYHKSLLNLHLSLYTTGCKTLQPRWKFFPKFINKECSMTRC